MIYDFKIQNEYNNIALTDKECPSATDGSNLISFLVSNTHSTVVNTFQVEMKNELVKYSNISNQTHWCF